jgi:N-acetylmuramoyl-L-alanine amidase
VLQWLVLVAVLVAGGLVVALAMGRPSTPATSNGDVGAALTPTTALAASVPARAASTAETAAAPATSAIEATVAATKHAVVAPRKSAPKPPAKVALRGFVVVIDAGHQAHTNNTLEPIGPGSSTKKPAVASGTAGVVTRVHESVINLRVALLLRDVLAAAGVKVVMVRTTENVNIPNSKRAAIANAAHAGLFVRLHCDGVTSSSVHGFLTLTPGKNRWTGPILTASARAGRDVQKAAIAATGAFNRGITPRSDMSGFNWSKVPSVIVEMGVMTNPAEDRRLSTSAYEQKLADGIAKGVLAYAAGK